MKRRATAAARRLAPLSLAALLALPLAGCGGGVLAPRTAAGADDLQEIKQRLVEIQRQVTVSRLEIEEMRKRLETLEAAAGIRRPTATRPAPQPRSEPRTETAPPPAAPAPRRDVTETRPPRPLEEPGLEESDVTDLAPPPAPDTGGEGQPISPAGQALYDRGYTLYHQGRYLDAEAAFQRFLQSHAGTDLADNAQYWIGEARYSRRDFSGALAAFREVVSRYPRGNKVPDALLKAGQSLEEVGDVESARASYREVIERFPGSAASAVAEERLARLP
jgi:tol-pal system protein YbgF